VVAVAVLMRAMNTLVFDIETVPTSSSAAKLHDVPDLDDAAVAKIMQLSSGRRARATCCRRRSSA
jgi:hypothetical protein